MVARGWDGDSATGGDQSGGSVLDGVDELGRTRLHLAADKGAYDQVAKLLADGACVHTKDQYEWTPLHTAAAAGHVAVVKALIAQGAYIDSREICGHTPAELARVNGHKEIVSVLDDARARLALNKRAAGPGGPGLSR